MLSEMSVPSTKAAISLRLSIFRRSQECLHSRNAQERSLEGTALSKSPQAHVGHAVSVTTVCFLLLNNAPAQRP